LSSIVEQHLLRELEWLRGSPQYLRLLGLVSQLCASSGDALAVSADVVLRSIARDLVTQSRAGNIILHITVVSG